MPISRRQGRSWVAACSTHSAPASASPRPDRSGQADRVDERGARALAAQLHQIGALAVAVAGGALGVDGDRAGAGGEGGDHLGERVVVGDDRRDALAGFEQGDRRRASGPVSESAPP